LGIDFETGPACQGAMRTIAYTENRTAIQKILDNLKTKDETCGRWL